MTRPWQERRLLVMDPVLALTAWRGRLPTIVGRTVEVAPRILGTVRSNFSTPVANPRSLIVCSVRIRPWVICST